MKLLLKSLTIIDSGSPFHRKKKDILIKDGVVVTIADNIDESKEYKVLKTESGFISAGWIDIYASGGDPGFEHKEDLHSICAAAAAGGFTGIGYLANTNPAIHSKSEVQYIINKTANEGVDVFPIGSISHKREGKELAELYDMHTAGAVAFSDADVPVKNSGLLLKALQYIRSFNGVIFHQPYDATLSPGGLVHEGKMSMKLGLKGMPSIAEEMMLSRDIYLAEYSGSRLHVPLVSTKRSVDLIRKAKARGVNITSSVSSYQLYFNDNAIKDYDPNYKVMPPLRSKQDIAALKKGLLDGTIDCVCSNHVPHESDAKKVEFEYAEFGMTNLETSYALAQTSLKETLSFEQVVEKLAVNPRRILNIEMPSVKEGSLANFTIFEPESQWTFSEENTHSKSKNTSLTGISFLGKVRGIINKNKLIINQ